MKLVFLADSLVLQKAGIKKYNLQLLETVSSYPNLESLHIIVPRKAESLSQYNQVVVPVGKFPGHQRLRQFSAIPKVVERLKPDLVIEPAHFGPFRLPKAIRRCTVIHDLTPITHGDLHPAGSVWSHRLLLKRVLRKSNLLLTNSYATKNSILAYYPNASQINVLYPEITTPTLSSLSSVHSELPTDKYILAIGTLEPRKGYVTLIKAFEKIESDCHLVIIGGVGWKHSDVDQYIEKSPKKDRIHIKGYISDAEKFDLISGASLFVSTSIAEGLGLPLLEVAPYDIPVICSDIAPYQEIGGDYFKYTKVGDIQALSRAIDQSLTVTNTKNFNNLVSAWNKERLTQMEELFTTFDRWH